MFGWFIAMWRSNRSPLPPPITLEYYCENRPVLIHLLRGTLDVSAVGRSKIGLFVYSFVGRVVKARRLAGVMLSPSISLSHCQPLFEYWYDLCVLLCSRCFVRYAVPHLHVYRIPRSGAHLIRDADYHFFCSVLIILEHLLACLVANRPPVAITHRLLCIPRPLVLALASPHQSSRVPLRSILTFPSCSVGMLSIQFATSLETVQSMCRVMHWLHYTNHIKRMFGSSFVHCVK